MRHIFSLFLIIIVVLSILVSCRNDHSKITNNTIDNKVHLHAADVLFADRVRNLIEKHDIENIDTDIRTYIENTINAKNELARDTSFSNKLLAELKNDNFIKKLEYITDLQENFSKTESSHFIFYFKGEKPSDSIMNAWDNHFERLAVTFKNPIQKKIKLKIDPEEKWGRCFAPWEIEWSIRQDNVEDNPHELAHIFLFKYSDVPFFHEPLAFIYGTHHGSFEQSAERKNRYKEILQKNGFISSTELLHFPQIIGLDETKWASAYFFVSSLIENYGLEKCLRLLEKATWDTSIDDYKLSFENVYSVSLEEYETKIENQLL